MKEAVSTTPGTKKHKKTTDHVRNIPLPVTFPKENIGPHVHDGRLWNGTIETWVWLVESRTDKEL